MISWAPIWAIVLRHVYMYRRDINLLLGVLYWPLLDIITWGFLGAWIQQTHMSNVANYTMLALLGILLWQIVGRGCNIMMFTLTEELWSNNIVTLFSLPLRMTEWICASLLFSVIMMSSTTLLCMLFIGLLYDISLWEIIILFLQFAPPLFFSSIWLGFTALSLLVSFGKRSAELGFVIIWFLLPFSGAYYPIDVLPAWGQTIASCLPMSYVFQAMRNYFSQQQDTSHLMAIGYTLSIFYALCALALFLWCFGQSKKQGLARLAQ